MLISFADQERRQHRKVYRVVGAFGISPQACADGAGGYAGLARCQIRTSCEHLSQYHRRWARLWFRMLANRPQIRLPYAMT